jgi:hypothetical protein
VRDAGLPWPHHLYSRDIAVAAADARHDLKYLEAINDAGLHLGKTGHCCQTVS